MELWIFLYPIEDFDRDASDEDIIGDYENNPDSSVDKMTLLEFAELINNDMFNL